MNIRKDIAALKRDLLKLRGVVRVLYDHHETKPAWRIRDGGLDHLLMGLRPKL